jgi:hypothetical protein
MYAQDIDPIVGREAIERFWKRAIERAGLVGMRRSIHHDQVYCSGDLGLPTGPSHPADLVRPRPEDDHLPMGDRVEARETDSVWRMIVDISNTDTPAQRDAPALRRVTQAADAGPVPPATARCPRRQPGVTMSTKPPR